MPSPIASHQIAMAWQRIVAREWLLFVVLLPIGGAASFFGHFYPATATFYRDVPGSHDLLSLSYDQFWNQHFGLTGGWPLVIWFIPYIVALILRFTVWAIRTMTRH